MRVSIILNLETNLIIKYMFIDAFNFWQIKWFLLDITFNSDL